MPLPASHVPPAMDAPARRCGNLGTSWIADQVIGSVQAQTKQGIAAVGARDRTRSATFAAPGTDPAALKLCIDTGHCTYAGFDPVAFMKRHMARITYVHFKSTDARVKAAAIANRTGFYDACGQGIFCNLADGEVDFPAVRQVLLDAGYQGWCTIEQDCDPTLDPDPVGDARKNREYLEAVGFS